MPPSAIFSRRSYLPIDFRGRFDVSGVIAAVLRALTPLAVSLCGGWVISPEQFYLARFEDAHKKFMGVNGLAAVRRTARFCDPRPTRPPAATAVRIRRSGAFC